jgi:8-oxo-dGTP pyrophosphatase MutT (NUDIX family)
MQKLFENWRRYLNETPFGGYNSGLAGTLDFGQGTSRMSHKPDKKDPPDDVDTKFAVKAVVHRSGEVVLLLNHDGSWDLPGGHKKRNEGDKEALEREIGEETSLRVDLSTATKIAQKGTATFYQLEYTSDANISASEEHKKIKTYTLEEVETLNNINDFFKKLVIKVLSGDINEEDIIS